MKLHGFCVLLTAALLSNARADLAIVQRVEGAGPVSELTIKIKGDKVRIDAGPRITTIIDSKTGEMLNLMNDQKKFLRISGEKAKAVAEMATRFGGKEQSAEKPKLTPTGKKETINGYETEEYTCQTPQFKGSYWIATNYPDSAAILKQLQATTPASWSEGIISIPDYRDFPGLPIRTEVSMKGQKIKSTITAVKQVSLPEAQFIPPPEYKEMKMPNLGRMLGGKSGADREEPADTEPPASVKP